MENSDGNIPLEESIAQINEPKAEIVFDEVSQSEEFLADNKIASLPDNPKKDVPPTVCITEAEENSLEQNVISADDLKEPDAAKTEVYPGEESSTMAISAESKIDLDLSALDITSNDDLLPSLGILPEEELIPLKNHNIMVKKENIQTHLESNDHNNERIVPNATTLLPSEVLHKEKRIKWKDIEVPIITQNNNGPCPLLAILNAMILKGSITLPRDRQELTGAELLAIVADAVLDVPSNSVPQEMRTYLEQNTQDAVDKFDKLLTGLDVNIKFSGVKDFEFTSELSVFDVLGISLYHGWVIDPKHEAASLVSNMSYNQLTTNIIYWREQATLNKDDSLLVKALLCEQFIDNSVSQLTYQGLYELGATLVEEEIAVLFRNNHFATVYKKDGTLYLLLTDQGYLQTSAVWETLTDVDSTFSEFVNGAFQPIQDCEPNQKEAAVMTTEQQINSDLQLATMLQEEDQKTRQREEDVNKMLAELGLNDLSDEEIARRLQERENQLAEEANRVQEEQQNPQDNASQRTSQSSRTSPQPLSPQERQDKKKKDCAIL